jgi:hypothetical protein
MEAGGKCVVDHAVPHHQLPRMLQPQQRRIAVALLDAHRGRL